MAKIIVVNVMKKNSNDAYPNAKVTVSGYSQLATKTDRSGKAVINYPRTDGTVEIYVNGETAYSGYVSNIPSSGVVAVRSFW